MFGKRFEKMTQALYHALGENAALKAQVAAMQTTMDWMRVRVNSLEHERAQLLFNYMGVKVAAPVIEAAPATKSADQSLAEILHRAAHFEDIGDEQAAKLGIGWNEDGSIRS